MGAWSWKKKLTVALSLTLGTGFVCATGAASAELSDATVYLRRHFMDADIAALTYQSMDRIFDTAPIKAGKAVWKIPTKLSPLNFTYKMDGQDHRPDEFLDRTYTNALIVIKDGHIVYERYRNNVKPSTRLQGMSMTKSINSILVGEAIHDGVIHSVKDMITDYLPDLNGTAYEGVTIEEALRMQTGVDRSDDDQLKPGTPAGDLREKILIHGQMRALDEAKLVKRKAQPGTVFDYSTMNATVLGGIVEATTHKRWEDYLSEKVWKPMGAESDAFVVIDGAPPVGHAFPGLGWNAIARDYARVGLMMLNGGKANGRQVVPAEWVRESTTNSLANSPGSAMGYKYQWWTLMGTNAYTALGLNGQFIFVDPDTKTVIVKLSYFPPHSAKADNESIVFFRAASAWTPH